MKQRKDMTENKYFASLAATENALSGKDVPLSELGWSAVVEY